MTAPPATSAARALSTLQIGFIVAGKDQPMTGSERYYFALVRALTELGIPTRGIVVGEPEHGSLDACVESFAPERSRALPRLRGLRSAVRRLRTDAGVIVSHAPAHVWPVLDLIRGQPLVMHFHGSLILEGRAEGKNAARIARARFAETVAFRRARRLIALSQANAAILHEVYGVPGERIRVVPGAVDLARFTTSGTRRAARERLGWPTDRPIVVAVRRLAATKGIEALIDAASTLRRTVPDALVVLVGRGPLREHAEARVAALGLENSVRFEGQLNETLPLAYRAADLSVVPSTELEGFGLSVLESLACGTPAIVTPVAGLPEVVRDLDGGLIMDGIDAASLARGISSGLSGDVPDEAACRAYAERFGWDSIARRVSAVYAEAM